VARLIKIRCEDTEIWMEAEEVAGDLGPQRVSGIECIEKAVYSFERISDTIRAYCASLINTFKGINKELAPDKIRAEFGIKISGEGNVYVVKSAAEASLKITAEWQIK